MKQKKHNSSEVEKEDLRLSYSFEEGVNFKDRVIRITGEIEDRASFDMLDSALSELERASKSTITLRINSPGGSVYEALAMVGRIRNSRCHIVTEGYGHVMSAATLILAAGDRRRMSRYCWAMAHQCSYMIGGSHEEVKEEVAQAEREEDMWAGWMSELSNEDKAYWFTKVKKKNVYMTSDECLKVGMVDEII